MPRGIARGSRYASPAFEQVRRARGLRQSDLPGRQANVCLIEQGRRAVAPSTQQQLGAVLECCIGDIFRVEPFELDGASAVGLELWPLGRFACYVGHDMSAVRRAFMRHALPTYRATSGAILAERRAGIELLERLERDGARCLRCITGRCESVGATYCRRCQAARRGEARAAQVRANPELAARGWAKTVTVPCFLCTHPMERPAWQDRKARDQHRRQLCDVCVGPWKAALVVARIRVARAKTPSAALAEALAIGEQLEERIRELRPPRFGRRPRPTALDIAIEVLHVTRGLSDAEIRDLLVLRRRDDELLSRYVPEQPNDRYVTRRREQALIRRRSGAEAEQLAIAV